jgi:lipopolysaccharide/colanic/teichoic acid biosynthesis glycosyltransferase
VHSFINYKTLKRLIDVLFSIFGLAILSPLLLVISALVWISVGRPVLFVQVRSGLQGKKFNLIKFRSMSDAKDGLGNLEQDSVRLTKIGRFLRRSSLDELPSFWNILRGEMSLVGPRPLLPEYDELYTEKQSQRLSVKPGITGFAQINGRNLLSWEDRFRLDVWYVHNCSMSLDLKILFSTALYVLGGEGVNAKGEATMSKFEGKKNE